MTIVETLQAARASLTPESWWKKGSLEHRGMRCVVLALDLVRSRSWRGYSEQPLINGPELALLAKVALGHEFSSVNEIGCALFAWNDAPERTLADVHAAFDAAIAIAQQQEQETAHVAYAHA